jgi:lipopolysaccharide/colanic/teichoic acid biosynthesis glycosyltransferase/GGDEF domain-containing protein
MYLMRLWNRFNPFAHLRQVKALNGIYSIAEFHALLERERARADRNSHEFSLLVFDMEQAAMDGVSMERLAQTITRRVRSTDVVGWYKERDIGIFLPDTPAPGAWKLAEDLCQTLVITAAPPFCKVYTYSPRLSSDDNGKPEELESGGVVTVVEMVTSDGSRFSHFTASKPTAFSVLPSTITMPERRRPAEKLELDGAPPLPAGKRIVDIVAALLAVAVLSPILSLIALMIKIVSPGPVFFKQARIGYHGKPFTFWKFRTMKVKADTLVHQQHLQHLINSEQPMTKLDSDSDSRIIPFGKILRLTGLDELPQLINVLRGEMSLIGPRPCLGYEARQYLLWQKRRFDAVPGLTGLWQVSGKNRTTFKEMMRLDIAYAMKKSFWLDAKIVLKTIPAIITQVKDGLSQRKSNHG